MTWPKSGGGEATGGRERGCRFAAALAYHAGARATPTGRTPMSRPAPARRYHREAYLFVFRALQEVQKRLHAAPAVAATADAGGPPARRGRHITAAELCEGVRRTAVAEFGGLAGTVLRDWGLDGTRDVGEIVFELVDRGELSASEGDRPEDFHGLFDFAGAFEAEFDVALAAVHLAPARS